MPKLTKNQRDAIAADHAAGYSVGEIAARNKLHRNTVSAHVPRPDKAPAPASTVAENLEKAVVSEAMMRKLQVLLDCVQLWPCSSCRRPVVVLLSQPNVFWQKEPCGWLAICGCKATTCWPMPGRDRALSAAMQVKL